MLIPADQDTEGPRPNVFARAFYGMLGKPVPYYARYPLWLILWKPIRKFFNVVVIPSVPFNSWRIPLYRGIGYHIGRNVFIGMRCYLDDVEPGNTWIGDGVVISYGCFFATHGRNQTRTEIRILDRAYLGMRANVVSGRQGVTIGRDAVIGAGALVLESIPDGCTAVGVPARVVKCGESGAEGEPETPG
jgi:acetyltransferase-like isoleucine patch superfamily enzyme